MTRRAAALLATAGFGWLALAGAHEGVHEAAAEPARAVVPEATPVATHEAAQAASRDAERGTRRLAKPLQQQAGLRTVLAAPAREQRWLPARVEADPRSLLRLSASEAGTVSLTPAARPGQRVQAGELLGWLTPALSTPATNDVAVALATAKRDTSIGRIQLERFNIDDAPQFEAKLPTPTLQVVTEYRSGKGRADALATGLRKPQPLQAPRSGRLLRAPAAAGRVLQAGEPLFEIDAPAAQLIVAESIDEDFDPAEAAVAETRSGQRIALQFLGAGFDAASRSRRAWYAPAPGAPALAVNETLRLAQPLGPPVVRLPAAALRREQGEAQVWIHDAAEHFVLRAVRLAEDPAEAGAAVRVIAGLAPGERVVVSGLAALAGSTP